MAKKDVVSTAPAIVEVAKGIQGDKDEIVTLRSGFRVRIKAVAASLVDQVTAKIKDPPVPMWMNEDKGREEPNYADPQYQTDLQEQSRLRGVAAIDAMVMFGFELVDGLPENERWVRELQLVGIDVNPEDDVEKEFMYKKFIVVTPDDLRLVTDLSGLSSEAIQEAESSFPSNS